MKISELMKILKAVKSKHGDLAVTQHQWNDPMCPNRVQGVEVINVKPHYSSGGTVETYALASKLRSGGHGGGSMFLAKYQKEIMSRPTVKVLHIYYDRA